MRITLINIKFVPSTEGNVGEIVYVRNSTGNHVLVSTAGATLKTLIKLEEFSTAA